jgi:hypothetical protein
VFKLLRHNHVYRTSHFIGSGDRHANLGEDGNSSKLPEGMYPLMVIFYMQKKDKDMESVPRFGADAQGASTEHLEMQDLPGDSRG